MYTFHVVIQEPVLMYYQYRQQSLSNVFHGFKKSTFKKNIYNMPSSTVVNKCQRETLCTSINNEKQVINV